MKKENKKKKCNSKICKNLLIILICYIAIKGILLSLLSPYNNVDYFSFNSSTKKIKKIDTTDYLSFNKFKIRNDFKDYEETNFEDTVESIALTKDDNFIYIGKIDKDYDYNSHIALFQDGVLKESLAKIVFKNTNNSRDVYMQVSKAKNIKNHIYTPIVLMIRNYYYQIISNDLMQTELYFINGEYEGYIKYGFHYNYYLILILKDDKMYRLMLNSNMYSIDELTNLLGTINIDK